MPHVALPRIGTDTAWRAAARGLIARRVPPTEVTWSRGAAADDLFAENLLRLGGVGIFDAADAGFAGTGNDDDRIVEIDRTGGLCGGRGGDHGAGGADHRRGQEIFELHRADPFVSLKVG